MTDNAVECRDDYGLDSQAYCTSDSKDILTLDRPVRVACTASISSHGLALADSTVVGNLSKVDVLIGSDQYWKVTTLSRNEGEASPVALKSFPFWISPD